MKKKGNPWKTKSTKTKTKTRAEPKPEVKKETDNFMQEHQMTKFAPKKICIVCEKDVAHEQDAVKVKEDAIIRTIRSIKQKIGKAKNNELYVCKEDLDKHLKKRKGFENLMLMVSVLCGIVIIIFILGILSSGKLDTYAFISIILICLLLLVAALLAYAPALNIQTKNEVKSHGRK